LLGGRATPYRRRNTLSEDRGTTVERLRHVA
jgi:hypothetical protein